MSGGVFDQCAKIEGLRVRESRYRYGRISFENQPVLLIICNNVLWQELQ